MRSADALGNLLIAKINAISEGISNTSIQEILNRDGIKSFMLDDPLSSISIVSESSFTFKAPPADILLAIMRDYYLGYQRACQQWLSVKELSINNTHAAWAVVSAYYCAFFCAIEILRLQGEFLLSLTVTDFNTIFVKATGTDKALFLRKKNTNFIGKISKDFSSITFKSSGAKPHQFAWEELAKVFSSFPKKTLHWQELDRFKMICQGQGNWQIPSEIRNRWNYRDAVFFCEKGRGFADCFLKIIKDNGSASAWICDNAKVSNENQAIASLATVCHFLWGGLEQSYLRGFSEKFTSI